MDEVRVPGYHPLNGIHDHIHAVMNGEEVDFRLALIAGSNSLTDEAKRDQKHFLKAFCIFAALEELAGDERRIDLGGGYVFYLGRPRMAIENDGEVPGVRVDGDGWLVLEGRFSRDGRYGLRYHRETGQPLWPLMIMNPPVTGPGPWPNFRRQAFQILRTHAEEWDYGD